MKTKEGDRFTAGQKTQSSKSAFSNWGKQNVVAGEAPVKKSS